MSTTSATGPAPGGIGPHPTGRRPATHDARADVGRPGPRPIGAGTWFAGRAGLIMPLLVAAWSIFLLVGSATMDDRGAAFPGPQFFPTLLGWAGLALALAQTVALVRTPEHPEDSSGRTWRTHSDPAALAWTGGGFLAFTLLLPWLGWILAGALLFWCVAHGFGSRRPGFDVVVALFMSSATYLAFDVGLGLTLPSGILGGGF
ncbi:tripartite tricarboxylate transporter TctB family protein [Micrococcus sp.]|uniref:tripartite tricarboxylate transporter TctB family protein n=1 Tax=Micrococcus sp. TaxID=1271 RepID=UPI002A91E8E6|nr:tripartite tricarboxylate transporter TctB family protein [Micrococcus sp.]MDY6055978.1 tripartite tricarboxylate transporter TctB family protein [Micrococcus sp.]